MLLLAKRRFGRRTYRCGTGGVTASSLLRCIVGFGVAFSAHAAVVEYFDPDLDNYFITADPTEQAFVDTGAVGRWQRTGNAFLAGGPNQVCRFYGNSAINPATPTNPMMVAIIRLRARPNANQNNARRICPPSSG